MIKEFSNQYLLKKCNKTGDKHKAFTYNNHPTYSKQKNAHKPKAYERFVQISK